MGERCKRTLKIGWNIWSIMIEQDQSVIGKAHSKEDMTHITKNFIIIQFFQS